MTSLLTCLVSKKMTMVTVFWLGCVNLTNDRTYKESTGSDFFFVALKVNFV